MRIVVMLGIILMVSACSIKPYSIIDGSQINRADTDQYQVIILSINEKLYPDGRKTKQIQPGPILVKVATTKQGFGKLTPYQYLTIDARPCVRYLLAAQHEGVSNRNWQAKIIAEEEISYCKEAMDKQNK